MKFKNLVLASLLIGGITFQSCKNAEKKEVIEEPEIEVETVEEEPMMDNITTIAMENDNFSTLVTALKSADLVEVLNGDGPYTVFAPTNDAFAKVPENTLNSLLMEENKSKLQELLKYHVVSGKVMAEDVVKMINDNNGTYEITTLQGGKLIASLKDGNVVLKDEKGNMSTVVMADVDASNGVIHAIDAVVMQK